MATKQEWIAKIKTWLPAWYYQEGKDLESAIIGAIAEVFVSAEVEAEEYLAQTFISEATGGNLALTGSERGVEKLPNETEEEFRERIRASAVISYANPEALKLLVDRILVNGECEFQDHFNTRLFLNRRVCANRKQVIIQRIENGFTVIFEKQVNPTALTYQLILKVLSDNKAFGVMFSIVERA